MSTAHPLRPVLVLGGDRAAHALRDALADRPGWCAPPAMDLLSRMSRLLWGHQIGAGAAGVSSLVDGPHLMAALRRVADALVSPAIPHGAAYSVDVVPNAELLGPYVRGVWPDALVVAIGDQERGSGAAAAEPDLWLASADLVADAEAAADWVVAAARDSVLDLPGPPELGAITFRPERSPLHERVIIVLGAARSGTTWLHRLLSANPRIAGTQTGETWLFPDVAPLWADDVREVAGDDLTLTVLRAFCDDLLSGLLRSADAGPAYVCEKTPTTVWEPPFVARLFPDAHYVHVVRDGRDVAASLALTRGDDADPVGAAREWVDSVGAIEAASVSLDRFREVRYEQMLVDSVGVVEELWAWIGVESDDESRERARDRSAERVTPLPARGAIAAGKWRNLSPAQQNAVSAVTDSMLGELGYEVGT